MTQSCGYFWSAELSQRQTGAVCPEKPERNEALSPAQILRDAPTLRHRSFHERHARVLELAHDPAYITEVREVSASPRRFVDRSDTRATEDAFSQALLAVCAGCDAADAVLTGEFDRAFCAIRPPGHHANASRAMGYCIFNNVAVAARYAQSQHGIDRVLIVDWDADPGNGTQEIFWEDPTVFTLSFHQADLFPAAGAVDLVGSGDGCGFNRNVPLAPGTPPKAYHENFRRALDQVASEFRPQLVLIAAGFDAHRADPQSKLGLDHDDFAQLTTSLLSITEPHTGGRLISFLEGGYNVPALKQSVRSHCRALGEFAVSPVGST